MASLDQDRSGNFLVMFRWSGKQYHRSIGTRDPRQAKSHLVLIENTLSDLKVGRLVMPPDADPAEFVISNGTRTRKPQAEPKAEPKPAPANPVTLGEMLDRYAAEPPPHLEGSTVRMQAIHARRILEILPRGLALADLDLPTAQSYAERRLKRKYHGKPIHRDTASKELKSMLAAWKWVAGRDRGLVKPPFALKDVKLPKGDEAAAFMSWGEIEREIGRGGLNDGEVSALWDRLWLDKDQVRGLLAHVETAARQPFLFPITCAAAYSGMRRSELTRSRIGDWRFDDAVVQVRQKKRNTDKKFTIRTVPIHAKLAEVMHAWFNVHPGGQFAFCRANRSRTTWDQASDHLKRTLRGSRWEVVRGFHVLRHSFASNLASSGTDQRMIDKWMGHSTSIRLRYQHLRPTAEADAIAAL
jgi:integrase